MKRSHTIFQMARSSPSVPYDFFPRRSRAPSEGTATDFTASLSLSVGLLSPTSSYYSGFTSFLNGRNKWDVSCLWYSRLR